MRRWCLLVIDGGVIACKTNTFHSLELIEEEKKLKYHLMEVLVFAGDVFKCLTTLVL